MPGYYFSVQLPSSLGGENCGFFFPKIILDENSWCLAGENLETMVFTSVRNSV